jgi:hypothetical protein
MQQKTILILLAVATLSSVIGGGAVFLATSKNNSNQTEIAKNSKSLSSTIVSPNYDNTTKSSVTTMSSSSESTKTESSQSSSEAPKSSVTTKSNDEKPTGQKFTGWLGSVNIEMYLNFDKDKITGKYYNSYDQKWYNLDGTYNQFQDNQAGTIDLKEFDNNLNIGSFNFTITNPERYFTNAEIIAINNQQNFNNKSIPSGLYYTKTLRTLSGSYTDKKGTPFDLFVSSNGSDIDNFVDITKDLIVRKLDNGQPFESTIFEDNGKFYFTLEDWKIPKNVKIGDKVKVTGKVRSYNYSYGFNTAQEPNYNYESTSQGFFQVKEVKKI